MKQTSREYDQSMTEPWRNPSHVRVRIENVDQDVQESMTITDNGHLPYSELETLRSERRHDKSVATLELNRWILDGGMSISDGSIEGGYIGDKMSAANGSVSPRNVITVDLAEPTYIDKLTLILDSNGYDYTEGLLATFYLNGREVTSWNLLYLMTSVVLNVGMVVDKIEVMPMKLLPYRRFRIETILTGSVIEFQDSKIVNVWQSHDQDPISRRLPQEDFDCTILDVRHEYDPDDPNGLYQRLDEHAPVSIQHGYEVTPGNIEWLAPDRYVMNGKPAVSNGRVTFSGTGIISNMTEFYYKSTVGQKNLYDMAVDVIRDAKVDVRSSIADSIWGAWRIDESLKTVYTTGILPIASHADCLQLIAHAGRCRLYTDDDNVVHMTRFNPNATPTVASNIQLDWNTIVNGSQQVSRIESLKSVISTVYNYEVTNEEVVVFSDTVTDETLHIEFGFALDDINVTVEGGSVISQNLYARAADIVLTPGSKTVTVSGKAIAETSTSVETRFATRGEVDHEDNPLITSDALRSALVEHVAAYLSKRNTYDLQYRGNPEIEVGDYLSMETTHTSSMPTLVLVDELTYNGALRGSLKVKGWN